jgi:hypothetical protein
MSLELGSEICYSSGVCPRSSADRALASGAKGTSSILVGGTKQKACRITKRFTYGVSMLLRLVDFG